MGFGTIFQSRKSLRNKEFEEGEKIKTGEEYVESLKELGPEVYVRGERVDPTEEPTLVPGLNSVKSTYEYAEKEEYKDLFMAESRFTGSEINIFGKIPETMDDLLQWMDVMRLLGKEVGCVMRCVGIDAIRSAYNNTYEIDKKYGTDYHDRLVEFAKYVQNEDLTVTAAMTDTWGSRSKSPHKFDDPDMAVRTVEEKSDGIVIRGVKSPVTTSPYSHEIFIMPTRAMKKGDEDWSVACAIPANTEGVKIISKGSGNSNDKGKPISSKYAAAENMIILDDVFVPQERVFMNGEQEFAGPLVRDFTTWHRQACGCTCKPGMYDVFIGAALSIAEYNDVPVKGHLLDKLTDLIKMSESLWANGIAAAHEGEKRDSGVYTPSPVYPHIGKLLTSEDIWEIYHILCDFAGGHGWSLPTYEDYEVSELKDYMNKYLRAGSESAEPRIKMFRLINDLTVSDNASRMLYLSTHGGGSPEAMRVLLAEAYDLEERKNVAKERAGIEEKKKEE